MSSNFYDATQDKLTRIAGGTLWADSPIGTILAYGGAVAPSGWFLCDGTAISRTTYSELFAVIGESFGAGDGSTTFNLPDMRGKFAEGTPSDGTLGASKSAGLPNITGYFNADYLHHGGGVWNGAFDKFVVGSRSQNMGSGSQESTSNAVHFDASKSNSIYGNSDTVQPPAVCVNYIIKAKMIGVPADFMGKVEETIADNFYYKSGQVTVTLNNALHNAAATITFPEVMPDTDYVINVTVMQWTGSGGCSTNIRVYDKTVNGFKISQYFDETTQATDTVIYDWYAFRIPH